MESRGAAWAVAAPLIAFKVWAAIVLLMFEPSRDGIMWIIATNWPIVVVLVVMLVVVGPSLLTLRLLRARARRRQLREAEWKVAPDTPAAQCSLWETVSRLEGGSPD
jgi:hypothetical protein